jgi:hypothetical protein
MQETVDGKASLRAPPTLLAPSFCHSAELRRSLRAGFRAGEQDEAVPFPRLRVSRRHERVRERVRVVDPRFPGVPS